MESEDKISRAADAFRLVVIEKRSLREAAEVLGVSHQTVKRDVDAYSKHLADERGKVTTEERRARFIATLDEVHRMALAIYNDAMKDAKGGKKPLAAVAALNTITALQAHYRAVGALDAPKEVKQDVDQTIRVMWEDDEPERKDYTATGFPLPE